VVSSCFRPLRSYRAPLERRYPRLVFSFRDHKRRVAPEGGVSLGQAALAVFAASGCDRSA
jgi:hypothetical protein